MADLDQLAAELRQQAEEFSSKAIKLRDAAAVLDGNEEEQQQPDRKLPSALTADELAEFKRLRDQHSQLQRRIAGLETRIKQDAAELETRENHIRTLEGELRDTDSGQSTRIATLQNECGKLREKVSELRSEKFSLEEDLKSKGGQVQELEALLEGATMPSGAASIAIDKLMPSGQPLATMKVRNGRSSKSELPPQPLVGIPRNPEVLKEWGDRLMDQEVGVYFRGDAVILRPLVAGTPPDTDEENARARAEGQTIVIEPAPEPEPVAPAEEEPKPQFGRKPSVKVTAEQFRDWLVTTKGGPFSRGDVRTAFNITDPTAKKLIDAAIGNGIVQLSQERQYGPGQVATPAYYKYVRPNGPGKAAELDKERKPQRAAEALTDDFRPKHGKPVAGTGKQFKGSGNPEVRALIEACKKAGASVSPTDGGHLAVTWSQDGQNQRVLISNTPRNPRTVLNDKARVRRAGLDI